MAETARGGPFSEILEVDIFINCIYLFKPIAPFITAEMLQQATVEGRPRHLSAVVDVSCDATNPHNPIPIYQGGTTFNAPTMWVPSVEGVRLELMAIDHLPTALPRESSEAFCRDLLPYLMQLKNLEGSRAWSEVRQLFYDKKNDAAQ